MCFYYPALISEALLRNRQMRTPRGDWTEMPGQGAAAANQMRVEEKREHTQNLTLRKRYRCARPQEQRLDWTFFPEMSAVRTEMSSPHKTGLY